jgi:Predicted membrane protein (DUF2207)
VSQAQAYALTGLVSILAYYLAAWCFVGRDPPRGVIVPLFDPPDGLSPAAICYLRRCGFDGSALLPTLLQIAVKGHLRIKWDGTTMCITRRNGGVPLTADEDVFFRTLLGGDELESDRIALGTGMLLGYRRALNALMKLQAQLTKQFAGVIWERRNGFLLIAGSLLSLAWVAVVGHLEATADQLAMEPGASSIGQVVLWVLIATLLLGAWGGGGGFAAMRITRGLLVVLGLVTAGLFWLLPGMAPALRHTWWLHLGSTALLAMNLAAWHLLPRPSRAWRLLVDRIEGFRMYLETAEVNEMDFLATLPPGCLPPANSTERVEMLIPYALALGIQPRPGWIWLRRADDAVDLNHFSWYEGTAGLDDILRWLGQAFNAIGQHVQAEVEPGER